MAFESCLVKSSDKFLIAAEPTIDMVSRRSLVYPTSVSLEARMDTEELVRRIQILREEHRDLDAAIAALTSSATDQLQIARLKKRKLRLRDEISLLEDMLIPDIIA